MMTPDSCISVNKADTFCESGLDLDSCSYLPLYKSSYDWLGVPYHYAGTSKKGVDCSGFVKAVFKEVYNIQLKGSASHIYSNCTPIDQEDLQEGDLVFFKINKSRISHIGIYLQNGFFVHASVSRGVMVNNLSEKYYKKYYYSGGRLANND
ncbi:C40 family peptidase [Parvicella tangerina]|nr:NlpC/P60 family protein [Parvicella tangerina]